MISNPKCWLGRGLAETLGMDAEPQRGVRTGGQVPALAVVLITVSPICTDLIRT